jgi:ribose transport system substrate-binding protein
MNNRYSSGSSISGRRHVSWTIIATFLSLLALAGCNKSNGGGAGAQASATPSDAQRVVKLAFVTNNTAEFWRIAAAGVRKYEKEGKVQVDIKMPPNGTTDEQNQILENLAGQGYDAIAVSPIAPNDQVPVLDRIAAKT